MKGIEIFCASQASTAICVSMDEASSSSSSSAKSVQLGGRAIDRHNPIISDSRRAPCASPSSSPVPPKDPKPQEQHQKAKKNSCSKPRDESNKIRNSRKGHHDQRKKSAAGRLTEHITNTYSSKPIESILRRSWVRPPPPVDLITPSGSSRYLLTETSVLDGLSKHDPVLALTPFDDNNQKALSVHQDETNHTSKPSTSSSSTSDQVVVLRVSLHCRGCEGKLRKHLSRMEGVTSFNIDFAAKKVTIVGDVTPLSVLASVSKVKNAQFWPVPATPSRTAEIRK
ncbi:hypothetical protein K1719_032227 [Acacia pycnantha]|nr:hypothetical protein K1719_046288 [Acacia pycnantha]KAI9085813.1 hypothetical protein K1719_032227 [Acacia pycnantha]